MALYLGNQRVAPMHKVSIPTPVSAATVTGQADIDENGILTFPKLDFTPKMITIWNIEAIDLKQEALENDTEWEDGWVRWVYNGVILTAINIEGIWISQGLMYGSGEVTISNATRDVASLIHFDGEHYSYDITRYPGYPDENMHNGYDFTTFEYAIYS